MIKFKVESFHLKVDISEPFIPKDVTEEERIEKMRRYANLVKAEIERHCDDIEYVSIEPNGHYECSFCGYHNVDKDDFECCDYSVEEHKAELEKK